MYDLLRGEVAKQKVLRRLTNRDLAKMCGYKESTIAAFLCGARTTDSVARALARALGIDV